MPDITVGGAAPRLSVSVSRPSRRRHIVAAAGIVAGAVGYDGMTMREVAEQAGMSTATVYRYFTSKAHVLVAVWSQWLEDFDRDRHDPTGSTSATRLHHVAVTVFDSLRRSPAFADAVIRAHTFADADAAGDVEGVRLHLSEMFAEAIGGGSFTEHHMAIGGLVSDVWIANALAVSQGRSTGEEFRHRLHTTARLIIDSLPSVRTGKACASDCEPPRPTTAFVERFGAIPAAIQR
ncbi:TetR family transcriptional regulator [Mycolicibacterium sp. 3033]|nr:TetR family transcriptional regulator [Mycolicibacterium aurantiacum]